MKLKYSLFRLTPVWIVFFSEQERKACFKTVQKWQPRFGTREIRCHNIQVWLRIIEIIHERKIRTFSITNACFVCPQKLELEHTRSLLGAGETRTWRSAISQPRLHRPKQDWTAIWWAARRHRNHRLELTGFCCIMWFTETWLFLKFSLRLCVEDCLYCACIGTVVSQELVILTWKWRLALYISLSPQCDGYKKCWQGLEVSVRGSCIAV